MTISTLLTRSLLILVLLSGWDLLQPVRAAAQFWGSTGEEIEKLAPLMDLKPGSTVAEVGAGNGAVAIIAAGKVGPTGHVYATEIDPVELQRIRDKAAKADLHNVTVVESAPDDTKLPPACCDAIYMIGVYHHFTMALEIDTSMFRALKPGGKLVVVDFRPSLWLKPWTPKGIPANRGGHGIPPKILESELEDAGFKIAKVIDPWGNSWFLSNYCVVFTKPGENDAIGSRTP